MMNPLRRTAATWRVTLAFAIAASAAFELQSQEPLPPRATIRSGFSLQTSETLRRLLQDELNATVPRDDGKAADLQNQLRRVQELRVAALQGLVDVLEYAADQGVTISPDVAAPLTFLALARSRAELARAEADYALTPEKRVAALETWRREMVTMELNVRLRHRMKACGGGIVALFQIASERLRAEEHLILELIQQSQKREVAPASPQ